MTGTRRSWLMPAVCLGAICLGLWGCGDGQGPAETGSGGVVVPVGPPSGNGLARLIEGRSFDVAAADGARFRLRYATDGTVTMTVNGATTRGVWAIGGDAVCSWLGYPGRGSDRCFRVEPQPDGAQIWRRLDGQELARAVPAS